MDRNTTLAQHGLFDSRVPRYTSYPPAPHFSPAVGADTHARWISKIPENSEISLYVHVPFCRRLCWFCACRTQGVQREEPVAAYLNILKAELRLVAACLPQGVTLSRLHWGGGTPTLLNPTMVTDLAEEIAGVLPFGDDYVFSVEIDPNECDTARLEALTKAGMNRVSIGVQDFDPNIQQTIGRHQPFDLTADVVSQIRALGVTSLNADILFGLPHQTRSSITDTVQKLMSFHPERVALYGYAHVPWMAKRQQLIPSDSLPVPEERLDLFDTARRLMVWDSYQPIGIDHFATPDDSLTRARDAGTLKRNFQGYTDDPADVLIGLGASAISSFPQGYTQNHAATSAHSAAIDAGRFSTARGHVFSDEDRLRAALIQDVMCQFRVDATRISRALKVPRACIQDIVDKVTKQFDGWLELTDQGFEIPARAQPLTRLIAHAFDTYARDRTGHSPAI